MLSSSCKRQPVTGSFLTQVIKARGQAVSSYESGHFQWQRCYTLKVKWFEANGPAKCIKGRYDLPYFTRWNDATHFTLYYQHHRHHNYFISQLGTSCAFDSPGLARNEPTPGEYSQGDSTPSVLSFFCEGMGITRGFMADYAKKPQHRWRCSTHNIN